MGILVPSMEAEAGESWGDAYVNHEVRGGYKYFWADVCWYHDKYHCVYGYMDKVSTNKICSWGQASGYGLIEVSTFKYATNIEHRYKETYFRARVKNELVSVK